MTRSRSITTAVILLTSMLLLGCAKTYVITQPLERPMGDQPVCSVGPIEDGLPLDMDIEDKPKLEDIEKLRSYIRENLQKEEVLVVLETGDKGVTYVVQGTILDYARGSGFLRFLFGAFAGSARLTVNLQLVEEQSGEIVFGGNFTEKVTSDLESGAKTYERVAQKFAKELRKQQKKLVELEMTAASGV